MYNQREVELLYDKYGAMLYGIALQLSRNESKAESILTATFQGILREGHARGTSSTICVNLVKLLMKIAQQQLQKENSDRISLAFLEKTPLLHLLICGHCGVEAYCADKGISRTDAMIQLKRELDQYRGLPALC